MALIKTPVKPDFNVWGNRCVQFPLNGYCEELITDVPVTPLISNINEQPLTSFYFVVENTTIGSPNERAIVTEWPSINIGL